MGPPPAKRRYKVDPKVASTTKQQRRCLLCRGATCASEQRNPSKLKSCAVSLCTIFGLAASHPFRAIYERAHYCDLCMKELQDADITLGKLELLKQSLLRFQNRVYSKLGENYFQIEDMDKLSVSFLEFEQGADAIKGKKFSYDEIVKVVYEKLDSFSLKWERFQSESQPETNTAPSTVSKVTAETQTENLFTPDTGSQDNVTVSETEHNDTWNLDDDHHEAPAATNDSFETAGNSSEVCATSSSTIAPLTNPSSTPDPFPFTKAPINFDQKIYCTYDQAHCKRFFYDNYNLQVHIRSFHHGNPLPHECPSCQKGFVDEGRLKNHFLRLHATSLEAAICEHCGKSFATPTILRDHVRRKHLNPKDPCCVFCGASFPTTEELTTHEDIHRSKNSPFACVYCAMQFPNTNLLKTHYGKQHAENKFTCPHPNCGKLLSSETSLKAHMNIHTDAYICETCGYSATSKNALQQHRKRHLNEKPFTCETCGKAFKYSKNLTSHQRIHTGEKPYICQICGVPFREVGYLRRHEESHSEKANYQCNECGRGFKVKEGLKKHMRIHSPNFVSRRRQPYKKRTEEQKAERRTKRREKRLEMGLPVRPENASLVTVITAKKKAMVNPTVKEKGVNKKVKVEVGAKTKRTRRLKMEATLKSKPPAQRKRKLKVKKEVITVAALKDLVVENPSISGQLITYTTSPDEITSAVESIQQELQDPSASQESVMVTSSETLQMDDYIAGEEVVYELEPARMEDKDGSLHPTSTTTYIPVTVVGVASPSDLQLGSGQVRVVTTTSSGQLVTRRLDNQYTYL